MLCVFDINETLLDLAALDDFFIELTGDAGARRRWFDLMIHNALTLTAAHQYRPFGQIAGACLVPIAAEYGRSATPEHQRELGERLRRIPAHPEVADALVRLRHAGFRVVTLTNSVSAVAEDQLRNAGLRALVDAVYSADQIGMLKPAPQPYEFVLKTEQVQPSEAVLVAAHGWDIAGAAAAGLRTAFVSRNEHVPLPAGPTPSFAVTDIAEVADQLIAQLANR
jgi:2-haloacid dehalogenase